MNNEKQKPALSGVERIVPEFRFPEFKDDGDWEVKLLGRVSEITTGVSNRQDSTEEEGKYAFFDRSEDIRTSSRYLFDGEAIIVAGEGQKFIPKYFIGKFDLHQRAYAIMDFKHDSVGKFLFYYIFKNNDYFLRYAVGSTVKSLRQPIFENMPILIPPKPEEQKKIANCLSSLDEVITAETEKRNLLKDHKKGLLQQLFPAEGVALSEAGGRNQPKFRFPEFKDDGWLETTLGDIGKPLMCKRILKEQTSENPIESVPFYKIGTFGKKADSYIPFRLYQDFKRKYSFPKVGDILISASGTIGRLVVYDGKDAYFQDSNIVWLGHNEDDIINSFLFYSYSTLKWQTSDGGVIKRLYNNNLKEMIIHYPSNKTEQQKIASCLSTVDALIAAQEQRIEKLQAHKKGLMQQLFPKIER